VPAAFVVAGAATIVFASFFDASGHAADHLRSARALFPMMAVYAVIVWAIPSRRSPGVWIAGVLLFVALLIVMAGNLRVVDAIDGENWTDEQADTLGPGRSGFDSGHTLATVGMWSAVGATVLLAVVLLVQHVIRWPVAVGAMLLSVVFPPWVIPGAGILVLGLALCIARARGPDGSAGLERTGRASAPG
jgi:hypothetical protein